MPHDANKKYRAIALAWLLSQNVKRKDIAAKLACKLPDLSKLTTFAEEEGYLSQTPTVLKHNINLHDWSKAEELFFPEHDITEDLKPLAQSGVHFEANMIEGNCADQVGYSQFIFGAAVHVGYLLRNSRYVGVMWGRTILRLVQAIQACRDKLDRQKLSGIRCVPLCGDPSFLINQRRLDYSASRLADALEETLTEGRAGTFPCLTGVPAYISRANSAQSAHLAWVEQFPGYHEIFGPKGLPLVRQADTVITGAGVIVDGTTPMGISTGDLLEELLLQETPKLTKADLAKLVYGDIGGILLEKEELSRGEKQQLEELNRGWTGAKAADLLSIAKAASPEKHPGTILIASSPTKGDLVATAIRRGFINHGIFDRTLSERLKALAALVKDRRPSRAA